MQYESEESWAREVDDTDFGDTQQNGNDRTKTKTTIQLIYCSGGEKKGGNSMTRSAPESPGRGCPIATDGKNSIPHTAYYSTVELVVEFSNRHIQRRRIGPGFRWKNHHRDRVHPDPKTTPLAWNIICIGRGHAFGSHLIWKHFQCIPWQNLVAHTLTQTWPCSQPSSQCSQPLVKQPAN